MHHFTWRATCKFPLVEMLIFASHVTYITSRYVFLNLSTIRCLLSERISSHGKILLAIACKSFQ